MVHQPAPQRREVGQPDQRRVAARQIRRPVHAAQRLVAPGRVGVVVAVPLQVVQEQVGDDVVGVPAVLGRAALIPAIGVLLPQQSVVLEVVDRLQQAEAEDRLDDQERDQRRAEHREQRRPQHDGHQPGIEHVVGQVGLRVPRAGALPPYPLGL